jgi:hypothetical protein
MRSIQATHNLFAVSAYARETALNTEQELDACLLVKKENVLNWTPRLESNADEATGTEEPTLLYKRGGLAEGTINFDRMQAQHAAFLLAYGLGGCSSAAIAGSVAAYKHSITPLVGGLDMARALPSFTVAMRLGKTVLKRLFASCFIDSLTVNFEKDQFCKASATVKGTGKVTSNLVSESITALDNATSLTLAANGVNGTTDQERLDNVQQIVAEYPAASGIWVDVTYSAVSGASPAVITITSLGGAGASTTYKLIYASLEPGTDWRTFPARPAETPLMVNQIALTVGGKWDNTAKTLSGGHLLAAEIKSLSYTLSNNLAVEFTAGAGNPDYANRAQRSAERTQKISLGREFWDYAYQQHMHLTDYFTVHVLCQGDVMTGETTERYTLEAIFPRCAVLGGPLGADGPRLGETLDIQVLEDDTVGSVQAFVKNKQVTYAGV